MASKHPITNAAVAGAVIGLSVQKGQSLRANTKARGGKPRLMKSAPIKTRIASSKTAAVGKAAAVGAFHGHQNARASGSAAVIGVLGGQQARSTYIAKAAMAGAVKGGEAAANAHKVASGSGSAKSGVRASRGGGGRRQRRDSRGRFA